MVIQALTERMFKSSDPVALNQLRVQASDLGTLRPGQDPAVMILRRKVLAIWQGMTPQGQLQQAMQIQNGIVHGSIIQTQTPGRSMGPGNHPAPPDLNAFLVDAEKFAGVPQLGQMNVRGGTLVRSLLLPLKMNLLTHEHSLEVAMLPVLHQKLTGNYKRNSKLPKPNSSCN